MEKQKGVVGCIYKITNTSNNKVYVGQTLDWNRRFCHHISYLKSNSHYNKHLQKAFNKYGRAAFKFEIISKCSTLELLNELEIYWIKQLQTTDENFGYNIQLGGLSDIPSERGKKDLQCIATSQNKPVTQYRLDGAYINEFVSGKIASQLTGCTKSGISQCCQKTIVQINGYQFRYSIEGLKSLPSILSIKERRSQFVKKYNVDIKSKRVIQKTLEGKEITRFSSISEATEAMGLKRSQSTSIVGCLQGKQKHAYQFKWEYETDEKS